MKPILTTITLLFFFTTAFTQQVSRSIITTAGDFSQNENGVSLSWTMGDVFSETVTSNHHLTEGFQQGQLSKTPLDSAENNNIQPIAPSSPNTEEKLHVDITTFPNPTVEKLSLKFETSSNELATVHVIDMNGKRIAEQTVEMIDGETVQIAQINELESGNYFLNVVKDGKIIASKSFVKVSL